MHDDFDDLQRVDHLTGKMPGGIALRSPGWGTGKRRRFIFTDRTCCHHVISRVAGGEMLFGEIEKEAFRKLMRRMEKFAGVEVLTYAVMSNHFHLLVRIPPRKKFLQQFEHPEPNERENRILNHLHLLYSSAYLDQLKAELGVMKENKMADLYEKTLQGYLNRLCSLKHFVKELKERFSRWFNDRHARKGTLWQERYRSILVEDGEALRMITAYIDLNPVRAGMVEDPKDYRWCGYGEARGGNKKAQRGICLALGVAAGSWNSSGAPNYRNLLLGIGMESGEDRDGGQKNRKGIERNKAIAELRNPEEANHSDLSKNRVEYFSKGTVLGSREFVESMNGEKREWFGRQKEAIPKKLPYRDSKIFFLRTRKLPVENLSITPEKKPR